MSNEKDFEQILKKIAQRHHTTPQNVEQDLQEVIDTRKTSIRFKS